MQSVVERVAETLNVIRDHQTAAGSRRGPADQSPRLAIILGSGLGDVADQINVDVAIDYADLPHFGRSAAAGHRGQWLIGNLHGIPVVAMAGRFHFYEGWTLDQIVYPVRVMAAMGATELIVSNAAGGVSPGLAVGDLVLIRDVISMMRGIGAMPLAGPMTGDKGNSGSLRPSALDSSALGSGALGSGIRGSVFDVAMRRYLMSVARRNQIPVHEGCYLAMSGPTYETRAEYRMIRAMGADVVGMSTVPEAILGRRLGMRVLGISMVSNVANPDRPSVTDHSEVIDAGRLGSVRIAQLISALIRDVLLAPPLSDPANSVLR